MFVAAGLLLGLSAGEVGLAPPARAAGIAVQAYHLGTGAQQIQALLVVGNTGSFTLDYHGTATAPLSATAPACWATAPGSGPCDAGSVQAALAAVGASVVVTGGPSGVASLGTTYTLTFADPDEQALGVAGTSGGGATAAPQVSTQCVFCLDTSVDGPAAPNGAAVLFVHGGGFASGSRSDVDFIRPTFEAAGYRVFSMDYRLFNAARLPPTAPAVPNCRPGVAPPTQLCADWLGAADTAASDVNEAVAWLRAQATSYGFDPARIAVIGDSAGAIAALANHYDPVSTAGRPAVTVSLSGIMDPARVHPGAGPVLLVDWAGADIAYGGGFLTGIDPQQVAEEIAGAARALGEPVSIRSYAGIGHGFLPGTPAFTDLVPALESYLDAELFGAADRAGTWTGQSGGGFAKDVSQQYRSLGAAASVPVPGDFDGDGHADLLWYGPGSDPDAVWFGGADGVLHDPTEWTGSVGTYVPRVSMGGSYVPTVGDLDGDGRQDIVWYSPADGLATTIWYGNGDRTFTPFVAGKLLPGLQLATGDIAGDGSDDVVLYSSSLHGIVLVRSAGPRGAFSIVNVTGGLAPGPPPTVADLDGDGRADLYWAQLTGANTWFGNTGTGAAAFVPAPGPAAAAGAQVVAADFDGDGRSDLYLGTAGVSGAVSYGLGTRAFSPPVVSTTQNVGSSPPVAGDFNGDGRAELLWRQPDGAVVRAEGTATRDPWPAPVPVGQVPAGARAALGDIDGEVSVDGFALDDVIWIT